MRIKQLSPFVASQIAAGEVIERPASVLKELLENSIDAGSTSVSVEIERGGLKIIRVRDNGCGICKDDLALALLQHTTSKIFAVEDLNNINSLGFRGEALASMAAVSHLDLVSKPAEQQLAWEYNLEKNTLQPASHNNGTCITVQDLFYNVPARRKFLRSEHAEYNYLEDLFRRIALSHFDIAFTLFNDGKKIKYLSACQDEAGKAKRLSMLCGNRMLEQSIYLDAEQNGLHLWGWLGKPDDARSNSSNQYFYINQRMVKDKLINHAIKQAYLSSCPAGKYPTYCLYLALDVQALDVNVHPTKHEVRFRDPRVIHAFLSKNIGEALARQNDKHLTTPNPELFDELGLFNITFKKDQNAEFTSFNTPLNKVFEPDKFSVPLKMARHDATAVLQVADEKMDHEFSLINSSNGSESIAPQYNQQDKKIKIHCVIGGNKLILAEKENSIILLDVKASKDKLLMRNFEELFITHGHIPRQALLMPCSIIFANDKEFSKVLQHATVFAELGFVFDQLGASEILLRTVPLPVIKLEFDYVLLFTNLAKLFKELSIARDITTENAESIMLTNAAFVQCVKMLLSFVKYPDSITLQEAAQLVQEILSLPIDKRETQTLRHCSWQQLQEFVYE